MATAKCNKCGGSAEGKTFEEASKKINHAVGLSRGIKCGANYGCVVEISTQKQEPVVEKPKEVKPTQTKSERSSKEKKESSKEKRR